MKQGEYAQMVDALSERSEWNQQCISRLNVIIGQLNSWEGRAESAPLRELRSALQACQDRYKLETDMFEADCAGVLKDARINRLAMALKHHRLMEGMLGEVGRIEVLAAAVFAPLETQAAH